jgi:YVTN family beta-propeller protein
LTATASDVWVAIFGRGEVVRIDPPTNSVKARISVGGNPEDVVLAAGSAWVPNENGSLARIDPATNAVTATIPIGADPDNAVFCRGLLWTSDRLGPYLRAVSPATNKVAVRVRVGAGSMGLACTQALWIANYDTGRVQKLDLSRRKVLRRLDVGFQPREIEPGAGALWVANQGSGTVSKIRP